MLFVMKYMQPTIAHFNHPLLVIDVTGYNLTAGDDNEMSVSIQNIDEDWAYDVRASLTVPSTVSGISIVKGSNAMFEEIYFMEIEWLHPVLYVSRDCPLGAYSLTLTLEYTDPWDERHTDSVQIGVAVDAVKPMTVDLDVDVEDYHITAGTENEINVSVTNDGEEAVYDVEVVLTSTSSSIVVLRELSYLYDEIDVGDRVDFRPLLAVSQGIPLGTYSLTLTLDYKDSKGVAYRDKITIGLFVDSVFSYRLTFKAEVKGHNIRAGAENKIEIVLTNTGDTPVYDIELRLSSTSPQIVVLKEAGCTFNVIGMNSSVYFIPTLGVSRNTPLGAYSLTLTLKYKDPNGISYSDSLVIGVLVDSVEPTEYTRIVVQEFQTTPAEIYPGDNLTMEMELKNWEAKAYDVQVQLTIDSQSPFVSLDPTLAFVGALESSQTAKIVYNLCVSGDANARLYVLQLVISYIDAYDQPRTLTEAVSIKVHSIIDFRLIDVQPSEVMVKSGEIVTIEADLLLLGTETVDFVEIEIVENLSISPFLSIPESYEYIGRVDPDSPVLFTIQFMVNPNATTGSYILQMKVNCWDGYNQQRQAMIELPVTVNESSDQNRGTGLTLWDTIWTIIRILFGVKP